LPLNLQFIDKKHKIDYCSNLQKDSLPISHTCFFTLDLPPYSSEDLMFERISYAIYNCGDIDADNGMNDIEAFSD